MTIIVKINGTGNITNNVSVNATENVTGPGNNTTVIDVVKGVNLTVSKSVNVTGDVVNGQTIAYTIVVSNYGPDNATNVVVTEILDSRLIYVSSSATQGTYNNNTGLWTIGTINNGNSVTLTIIVKINGTGSITNNVSVNATENVTGPGNNTTVIDVVKGVNLTVSKSVNGTGSVVNGQTIAYTIVVTNHGPDTAHNVIVTENLPSSLLYQSHSVTMGAYNQGTGEWAVGNLTNGQSATLIITVKINGTGNIGNTVNVTVDEPNINNDTNGTNITENITVMANTGSTIVVPSEVRVGKTINITGLATDENGNPLGNIDLTVIVDGKTYTVTTDKDGRWNLAYKPTNTGNVAVSVSWVGNSTHNGFTNSTKFNVAKGNINVNINVTENDDGSVTVTANVTDEDGDPVSDYPVDFILDGKTIGHGTTDNNGIATITIPANRISDGKHTITVRVSGSNNYNDGIASIDFTKTNKNNETKNTNKTNNNPATAKTTAMKNTGNPITAILLILTVLGITTHRRKIIK